MRKCFIHLGSHKTGSTSLQQVLSVHATDLVKHGFHYPLTGRLERISGHHNVAWGLFDHARYRAARGTPDELIAEIGKTGGNVIVSSEDFLRAYWRNFAKFKTFILDIQIIPTQVLIIVYLRNQLDFIRSNYFERLKGGMHLAFADYVDQQLEDDNDEYSHDYLKLLAPLDDIPNINLVVRSYDAVKNGMLTGDFLSVLGLTPQQLNLPDEVRANVQLPAVDLFKRYYGNRAGRSISDLESRVIDLLFSSWMAASLPLSDKLREKIISRFSDSNRRVEAKYGLDGFGNAFDAVVPANDTGLTVEDIFNAALPDCVEALVKYAAKALIEPGTRPWLQGAAERAL